MKKILKTILTSAIAMPLLTACEMDQFPEDRIPSNQALENVSDAKNYVENFYANFRAICMTGANETDLMVDYFQPTANFGNNGGNYYSWQYTARDFGGLWSYGYADVAQANFVLSKIGSVEANLLAAKPKLSSYIGAGAEKRYQADLQKFKADSLALVEARGTAYFLRAFCYSKMAPGYCQDYDLTKADKQLGLPLVTSVDINAKPSRASLKATYAFIKKDLEAADTLLTNTDMKNGKFTTYLVNALTARVALDCRDYQLALDKAAGLINSGKFSLSTDPAALSGEFTDDAGGEFIFVPYYDNQNELAPNHAGDFRSFDRTLDAYTPFYVLSKSTAEMYSENDIRAIWLTSGVVQQGDARVEDMILPNKYPGNPRLKTNNNDEYSFRNAQKPFRIAEQYLIAAEAAYRLNQMDKAHEYLNALRVARGLEATQSTGKQFEDELVLEWKREFFREGKYFFVLKRFHRGFTRDGQPQVGAGSVVYQTLPTKYIKLSIQPEDKRWTWELPDNDLTTNKNLKPNWKEE